MNMKAPVIITTTYRVSAVLPPTENYRWNRNLNLCVCAEGIEEANRKVMAAYPDAKVVGIQKSSDIHIL